MKIHTCKKPIGLSWFKIIMTVMLVGVMGYCVPVTAQAAPILVTSESQLVSDVAGASGTVQLELDNSTPWNLSGSLSLTNLDTSADIIIDGNGVTLFSDSNAKHFTVNNPNGSKITLKNIIFDCGGLQSGINIAQDSNVEIVNCVFMNGKGGWGTALEIFHRATVVVDGCTFKDNQGLAYGYNGGAIALNQSTNISLTVKNTYFLNNSFEGGTGGAIGVYRAFGSTVTIDRCVFGSNNVVQSSDTSDGGAIAVKSNSNGGEAAVNVSISNSTFFQNKTKDDAGAILLEGGAGFSSPAKVSALVYNCTFLENEGDGVSPSGNGGAIQVYGRGVTANILYNTFYGNKVLGTSTTTVGGAVSSSGDGWRLPVTNIANNLFVDNMAGSTYDSVFSGTNKNGNVGYSANPDREKVFGFPAAPVLKENGVAIKVGSNLNSSAYETTLTTLLIAPDLGDGDVYADGAANTTYEASITPSMVSDQRGRLRTATHRDAGAVEINWLKFDANGGKWAGITSTTYNGDEYYVYNGTDCNTYFAVDTTDATNITSPTTPTNGTYTLIGWSTTQYAVDMGTAADCVDPAILGYSHDTLYAVWRSATYSVTYDPNGGAGGTTVSNLTSGTSHPVYTSAAASVSRAGYTFLSWNTQPGGGGTTYHPGDTLAITGNQTLYAIWGSDATYSVTYDSNGGTGGTTVSNLTSGSTHTIYTSGAASVSRAGYTFLSWNTQPGGGGTTYNPGDTLTITGDQTLYAIWGSAATYSVTYNPNGGTGGTTVSNLTSGTVHSIYTRTAASVSRSGYTFLSWNTKTDGSGTTYAPGDSLTVAGNHTLYAIWSKNSTGGGTDPSYTVTYDANGGTGSYKDTGLSSGTNYKVKDATTVKIANDEKPFKGWNTKADGTGVAYAAESTMKITSNITLYAQWGDVDKDIVNKVDHVAYIIGYGDDTVRPEKQITRAEVATIFFRLLKEDARKNLWSTTNAFSDVSQAQWYNNAVSTMSNAKIISGYPDGTFGGEKQITRAEFAAIVARFESDAASGEDKFSDISGHWAASYINRAAQAGWITGYEDGTFKPDQYITRAEAMTLINRFLDRDQIASMHADMKTWTDNASTAWYYEAVQEATNSHTYSVDALGNETWTAVTKAPDWAALEKSWSTANS